MLAGYGQKIFINISARSNHFYLQIKKRYVCQMDHNVLWVWLILFLEHVSCYVAIKKTYSVTCVRRHMQILAYAYFKERSGPSNK